MFTDVLQTFLKFSIICALFIVAFAFGFYAQMAEQENFSNVGYSMLKTSVMMIGEFEYDAIFFEHDTHDDARRVLPYKPLTILFFLAFVIIMPIIIMNLLVRKRIQKLDSFICDMKKICFPCLFKISDTVYMSL